MNKIRELLAENIRADVEGDDDELRQSLKENGWVAELPALADEAGVVLVGNRRLRLAKELGIAPVIRTVIFGRGDAADAERVRLAIVSNIGSKPMTKKDRQRIAQHLYGGRQWTMERIAKALSVTQRTISEDLRGLEVTSKPLRPKGGRPKGAPLKSKYSPDLERSIASAVLDRGRTRDQAAAEAGVSDIVVRRVVARELGRREVELVVARDDLTLSQQKRVDAYERRLQRDYAAQYDQAVQQGINEHMALVLPDLRKREAQASLVLNRHKGLLKRADYRQLLACLHPDGRTTISDATLTRLRQLLEDHEIVLCREPEPVASLVLPGSVEAWRKMRQPIRRGKKGDLKRV